MDPRTRQQLTHYGVPAAFLAAVTIAVILVKAGLNGGSESTTTLGLPPTTSPTRAGTTTKLVLTTPQGTTGTTDTATPGAEYYVVQSGDTLGSVAGTYSTTVDELMTLNPGIDPTALHIGQKIRVK
ncbi:MAG: LysM domain [Gaiellaceae bacterium]|nr:LysM domain [Gaiellaceae bacterium]